MLATTYVPPFSSHPAPMVAAYPGVSEMRKLPYPFSSVGPGAGSAASAAAADAADDDDVTCSSWGRVSPTATPAEARRERTRK